MKMKGISVVILMSAGLFLSAVNPGYNPAKERLILNAVVNYMDALHLDPVEYNDEFSEQVYDNYIQMSDGSKRFLTQVELDILEKHRHSIDDQITKRSFDFFNESETILTKSIERAESIYNSIIDTDFSDLDDEKFERDVEKRVFAKDEEDLKLAWKKVLKYEINARLNSKIDNQNMRIEAANELTEEELEAEADEEDEFRIKSEEELYQEAHEATKKSYDELFDILAKIRRSDRFETFMNAIVFVFDPHSQYFNPKSKEDFDIRMGGKLEGIGARLSTVDDFTKVVSIVPGGPAWKGKELEEGDLITAVKQEGEEPVSVVGMRLDDVVQKIRGDKGTLVTLTVKKADGSTVEIVIERDEVMIDESFARSLILDIPETIENVGYIKLPKFYSSFEKEDGNSCAKDVKIEIEKLKEKNVSGIILDLRNNGGGSLQDVIDMTGLFIEEGPIVQVKARDKDPFVYEDEDSEVHYTGPLVVMVNQVSASASEIMVGALQDYGRAVIVGSNSTFGKGTVQRFVDLDRAYRGYDEIKPLGNLKITLQKFFRVDGGSNQLKGVIPDIVLPDNWHYIDYGESDNDNAISWTEVEAVEFDQDVYSMNNLNTVISNSNKRVESSDYFNMILRNAKRLKNNRDQSSFPLDFSEYTALNEQRSEEAEVFSDYFDAYENKLFVANLEADQEYINVDESRVARNEDFIKRTKSDVYLEEVMYIMKDMISGHKDLAHKN